MTYTTQLTINTYYQSYIAGILLMKIIIIPAAIFSYYCMTSPAPKIVANFTRRPPTIALKSLTSVYRGGWTIFRTNKQYLILLPEYIDKPLW